MPRLYFALWPEPPVRAALAAAATAFPLADGRRVPAENLHLTMAFLGDVDDAAAAAALAAGAAACRAAGPFELVLGGGHTVRSRMLWLLPATVPAPFTALREALKAALEARQLPVERRRFQPHVTLARKVKTAPAAAVVCAVRWPVRALTLVASQTRPEGARYQPVSSWPLAAAAAPGGAPDAV